MDEHTEIVKGMLMQTVGTWKHPVAYLSKNLDLVAAGLPPCLCIIEAVALLVKDADKLTLGQNLTIAALHVLEGILK